MKNNSKKIFKCITLLFVVLAVALVGFTFAKYKSDTPHKIVQLFTKYNVNYQTSGGKIKEPEKFNTYYSAKGLTLPVEGEITRTSYDFIGWYIDNSFTGDAVTEIKKGEVGDKQFFAAWNIAQYDLKVQTKDADGNIVAGLPEGYEIVIGKDDNGIDNVITLNDKGEVIVGKNEVVSIRTPYSEDVSASGLSFSDESISLTMRYIDGEQYVYYDFNMPRKNLTVTYSVTTDTNSYIDISKSSIIFEKNVSSEGSSLTKNGFWYKAPISGMVSLKTDAEKGNFYEWDYSKPFYVTSKNKETQNQLILVDGITVYFKDCNLVATDSYTSRISGLAIDGKSPSSYSGSFGGEGSLTNIANVVIDNSTNYKYTTNMYFLGNNIINCISQSKIPESENYYGAINLYGTKESDGQSKLQLGSLLENGTLSINDLTINEYSNDTYKNNSDLLFFVTAKSSGLGDINIKGTTEINAPNSWVYLRMGTAIFKGTSKGNLKYIYGGQGLSVTENSNLLIQKDVVWGRGFSVSGSAYLVVNGNILDYNHDNNQNPNTSISTSKYVIVKGNRAEFNNFNMSNGTVIANIISISYSCNYTGGTIITNQIANYIADVPVVDATSASFNISQVRNAESNPFYTHSSNAQVASKYKFVGGNVYLFGTYKVNGNNYDLSYTAMSSDNPIGEIINSIGELNSSSVMPTKDSLLEKINSINTIHECMVLGNNTYNTDGILREFYLSGTNFYATGNLNFFNDTYISGGEIIVPGNVSSELDLTITGGTIKADKIGNSSNLLYTSLTNKLKRWPKTKISDNANITTSRIGATKDTDQTRSVVQISGGVITPKTSDVQIVYDMYLNYSVSSEFTNPTSNPSNIRYSGILGSSFNDTTFNLVNDDLTSLSSAEILPPIESSSSPSAWVFKSLSGYVLDSTTTDGYLTYRSGQEVINPADPSNEYVVFYAAKSNYTLSVKEGSNYIADSSVAFSDNYEVNVKARDTVSITLNDASMENKTVIWYYDADGLLHNVSNTDTDLNGVITFAMPRANTEIYITSLLKLYLDEYEIELNDDGFQVELTNTRDDSIFKYSGNYMITQRNTYDKTINVNTPSAVGGSAYLIIDGVTYSSYEFEKYATFNRIKINMSNWDGTNKDGINQKITLYKVIQKFNSATDYSIMAGIEIGADKKAAIEIDGNNVLCFTKMQATSDLYYYGSDNANDRIILQYTGKIQNWSQGFIGNQGSPVGATGDVLIEDLTYLQKGNNVSLAKSSGVTSTFTMNNSIVKLYHYYAGSGIAPGFNQVDINNSDLDMYIASDTSPGPFTGSKTVNINNTMVDYSVGGARNSTTLFHNVTNFNVTGTSKIKIKDAYSQGSTIRNVTDVGGATTSVVLKDSASLTAERRIRIPKLSMYDNSSLNVTGLNNSLNGGYLFCSDIKMHGGEINSDYILLSGFNKSSSNSITVVKGYLENDTNMVTSGSLTMTGGKIVARTFIGGNKKTTITLSKDATNNTTGVITAKNIGTVDREFGIAQYTPKVDEEYVYTYSRIPIKGSVITLNDGVINVSDDGYLGGMNAKVDIKGGTVNLGENAEIGMSDEDATTLINSFTSLGNTPSELVDINISGGTISGDKGSINVPYSILNINNINSKPSMKLNNILADYSTVTIEQTANNYDNPLGSGNKVGIIVNNDLIAQRLQLSNGASLYAKNAIIRNHTTTTESYLKVDSTSALYSSVYGTDGVGNFTLDNKGTIVGKRQYSIDYDMSDTFVDQAENLNSYNYVEGTELNLVDPSRFGYIFKGWFDEDGNQVTKISKDDKGNKKLIAHWEAKTVDFVITTSAKEANLSVSEFANQVNLSLGTLNEAKDKFTYTTHVSIPYHSLLNTKFLLSSYNLSGLSASGAKINNDVLNPDGDILNLTSTGATVTREIMEYYLKNNVPIEISVCEYMETLS